MNKKGISIAVAFLALFIPFFVFAYTSPGKPTGFVNDFANILNANDKAELENILSNYQKQSTNEISVVTISSLGDETIDTYAYKLFQEWGIGKKGNDNGLLMIFSMNDRKMRIEVGYGLEQYITDAKASSIIRNILTPAFKSGDYYGGIKTAVSDVIRIMNGEVNVVPEDNNSDSKPHENIFFWIIFIFIWLASILGRSKSWWLGGVLGGIAGIVIGFIYTSIIIGIIFTIILIIVGLIFDFIVSSAYAKSVSRGFGPPWWIGGGRGGGFGGGFGGFGGGGSGGGGSSGGW